MSSVSAAASQRSSSNRTRSNVTPYSRSSASRQGIIESISSGPVPPPPMRPRTNGDVPGDGLMSERVIATSGDVESSTIVVRGFPHNSGWLLLLFLHQRSAHHLRVKDHGARALDLDTRSCSPQA